MFVHSEKSFEEAKRFIVGGVNSPVRAFNSVGGNPLFINSGKGSYITDVDNNVYLDYVQSWGPLILGHCDSDVMHAIDTTLKKGLGFGAPTLLETKLAKEILSIFDYMDKIRFVSSGTEAVMSAIRVARGYTNKDDIIKFEGCYHGHSDSLLVKAGSGALTFGTPSSSGVPKDFTKHTLLATYNDIESVKECFKNSNNIASVIIEATAGNMGLVKADEEFLKELRTLCDENNTLLIFDEIMSGFRASLKGSVTEVKPDMITLGKVIGGGLPVGAFMAKDEVMDKLSPNGDVYQAGTLSGNPIAVSAGLATIRKVKSMTNLYEDLEKKSSKLMSGFRDIASSNNIPIQTECVGSMFGFFFNDRSVKNFNDALTSNTDRFAKFHQAMLKEGFYFACSAFESGFISVPMSDKMVEDTLKAFDKVAPTI